MKSKKVLSVLLAALMVLILVACSSGNAGGSSAGSASTGAGGSTNPLAKTPYSDGPDSMENIVNKLVSKYKLDDLSEEDKKYEINLGYYNCDHMTAGPIGEYTGIYKALGMNVKVTGNANVPEAMQAGQMDMAYCGWTTTLSAVQKNVPLFIAAENHTGGAEYLVVRKGIDMSDPKNLIGKSVSIGTDAEKSNLNWAEWTEKLGIPRDPEQYQALSMKDADEYLAMVAGQLDAYICCDPWGTMAKYSDVGNIIIRQDTDRTAEGLGHGTCCKVAMNYNFAKAHPRLAERMLLAHTICLEFCYEHPYLASIGFSGYYNVPVKVALENFWRKFVNEGRTLRWDLNRSYMDNQLATMRHYGVRDDINSVDLDNYVDLTYFNNSGADDFTQFISKNIDPVFPEGQSWEDFYARALAIDGVEEKDIPEYASVDRK